MKAIFTILLIFTLNFCLFSQDANVVSTVGKALVQWYPERESLTEARARALELAKIDALENAFGTVITQGNVIYVKNKKTGEKIETNSIFKMIGNTTVKGEIIDVKSEKYDKKVVKSRIGRKKIKMTYISCKVKVLARELTDSDIEIENYPLNSLKILKPVFHFKEGDNLYLYFKSPVNGYLTVFLDDMSVVQCLLPYRNMPDGLEEAMPIKANKEYVFFSDFDEHNYFDDDYFAEDTYKLVAADSKDINELVVVFSKEKLNRPIFKDASKIVEIDDASYELPRTMNSIDFKKWLVKIKQFRNDLKINKMQISIEKE